MKGSCPAGTPAIASENKKRNEILSKTCFQIENWCKERVDLARADSMAEPEYFEVSNHMDL